jgi:F0F1-type ATP synthase membrane subunit b/b'
MTTDEIKTATREELANELAAACEYTEDWQTATMDDLRERVVRVVGYTN